MRTVDMHEAETHLARLVEGKPFIIARTGKPPVKVVAVDTPPSGTAVRTGFLAAALGAGQSRVAETALGGGLGPSPASEYSRSKAALGLPNRL